LTKNGKIGKKTKIEKKRHILQRSTISSKKDEKKMTKNRKNGNFDKKLAWNLKP
jgi:hypothetical protein